jgi:hypothetical protein
VTIVISASSRAGAHHRKSPSLDSCDRPLLADIPQHLLEGIPKESSEGPGCELALLPRPPSTARLEQIHEGCGCARGQTLGVRCEELPPPPATPVRVLRRHSTPPGRR